MYRCIVADPAWKYNDKLQDGKGAEAHYRQVMSTDDICALVNWRRSAEISPGLWQTLPEHEHRWQVMGQPIADDAILWLWVTLPFFLNGDGCRVVRAWGFEPKTVFHWIKGRVEDDAIVGPLGLGRYLRVDTEYAIVATRGKATNLLLRHDVRNYTLVAPKTRTHSEKPQAFFDIVETLVPGPYLELFARKPRFGWDVVGDEVKG